MKINERIAKEIMGWVPEFEIQGKKLRIIASSNPEGLFPHYDSDPVESWKMVEEIRKKGWDIEYVEALLFETSGAVGRSCLSSDALMNLIQATPEQRALAAIRMLDKMKG